MTLRFGLNQTQKAIAATRLTAERKFHVGRVAWRQDEAKRPAEDIDEGMDIFVVLPPREMPMALACAPLLRHPHCGGP